MSVIIVTDSNSDILPSEAKAMDVRVVPVKVLFGEEEYRDNIDITASEFYKKLREAKELPTTTQPSTEDFLQAFEGCDESDEIVGIYLASALSGTYQGALIASELAEGKKIYNVDSETVALGLKILVMRAVELRDAGCSASEIYEAIQREKKDIVLMAVVDTLKYLQKGGRLSKTAALAGGLLGVKPILSVEEGKVKVIGKERGLSKAFAFIKDTATGMGKRDRGRPCSLGYTESPVQLPKLAEILGEAYAPDDAVIDSIGTAIGTHVGPGAAGLAYFIER